MRTVFLSAVAAGALLAGPAFAQDTLPAPPATPAPPAAITPADPATTPLTVYSLRARDLIGDRVINAKDEKVGAIDDVVIGTDSTVYAIISVGGFLGIGDRLVAVPLSALKRQNGDVFVYDVSKDALKAYPEFKPIQIDTPPDRAMIPTADGPARTAYMDGMKARVRDWDGKVTRFVDEAQKSADDKRKAAAARIDTAWSAVKREYAATQSAAADRWDRVKEALDSAWRDFQRSWDEATRG